MKVLIVNGPNLNMLGQREVNIYGKRSYKDLCNMIKKYAKKNKIKVKIYQSNEEGKLVTLIQKAKGKYQGIICNLAAYTHTSIALLDALKVASLPTIEVHISDVSIREDFRQISYIRSCCQKTISGKGLEGYLEALDFFNSCRIQDEERRKNAVIITPFRAVAERINADRLNQIQAPEIVYSGELSGTFSEKDVPAPLQLTLKIGALVVFVKNGDKWHNGSMGIVRNLSAKEIQVQLLSGNKEIVNVKPEKWQKIEYIRDENDRLMENEVGAYKQFPLNLGYAMTIHKAQGKTLDAVVVDISRGAFEHGQTYVALSRTRNSADMHLASPLRNKDVIFDNRVLDFVNNG